MNTIGIALVWCIVQVTVLGLLAAGLYLLVRRFRPAAAAPVVLTGLVMVVVLSLLALSPWPRWMIGGTAQSPNKSALATTSLSSPLPPGDGQGVRAREPGISLPASPRPLAGEGQGVRADRPSIFALFWQTLADDLLRPQVAEPTNAWHWPAVVAMLLLAAMTCGLAWLALGIVAVRRQRMRSKPVLNGQLLELVDVLRAELGCQRPVEVRQSDDLATAATIGWRRPALLLPADWTTWTAGQRRAVLAHEIVHARRHDFLALLFGQLGLVLHCYHPLLHWLMNRLRLEQELAADAAAASVSGGQWQYLTTIAELALGQQDRPLSWPARTFLPTRTTFLRRISMLRDSKLCFHRLSPVARLTTVGAVLLCGLLVAGLRGPGGQPQARAAETPPAKPVPATVAADQEGIDWSFVPASAVFVAAARPAAIFQRPELDALGAMLNDSPPLRLRGIKESEIAQTTFALLELPAVPETPRVPGQADKDPIPEVLFITQMTRSHSVATFLHSFASPSSHEYRGKTYFCENEKFPPGTRTYCIGLNDRTVATGSTEKAIKQLIDGQVDVSSGLLGCPKFIDADQWKAFQGDQAVVAVSAKAFESFLKLQDWLSGRPQPFLMPFAPLWQQTTQGLAGVRLGNEMQIHAILIGQNGESAEKVEKTIEAARQLAIGAVQAFAMQQAKMQPELKLVPEVLGSLLNALRTQREGTLVSLRGTVSMAIAAQVLPAISAASNAARLAQSMNNLKQLALAMLNYENANEHLPPAVLRKSKESPTYSWRVELLPYLEHKDLYDQYRFDEPWDGPNNRKLLEKMPPSSALPPTRPIPRMPPTLCWPVRPRSSTARRAPASGRSGMVCTTRSCWWKPSETSPGPSPRTSPTTPTSLCRNWAATLPTDLAWQWPTVRSPSCRARWPRRCSARW